MNGRLEDLGAQETILRLEKRIASLESSLELSEILYNAQLGAAVAWEKAALSYRASFEEAMKLTARVNRDR